MEKEALLGGPCSQPRPGAQPRRPAAKTVIVITIVAFWAFLSWDFLTAYQDPRPRNAEPEFREYAGESIQWHDCGDIRGRVLECGTVDVPMDHFTTTHADKDAFQIPLVRMRGKTATKNLLVNPGGPGGSGTGFLYSAGATLRQLVGEDLHIVGFDPRGVNASTPAATCYVDATSRVALRPRRATDLIRDSPYLYAWSANYGRACQENAGAHLPHVNTPQTAADMNGILDALGQQRMAYWGVGYGALLGQVYATLFPERAERMVLDAVPDQFAWFGAPMGAQRYADTEAVVDGFFDECARAGDGCALSRFGRTGPGLRENVTRVINRLYRNPASVYVNGTVYGVVDDFAVRIGGLFREMHTPAHWPALAQRLAELQEGNATGMFLAYAKDGSFDSVAEANLAVQMNDGQSGPEIWPQPRLALMEKLLFYFDKYRFAIGDMLHFHVKQQWPIPKAHSYVPQRRVETAAPLLILSTRRDPACPYASAQAAQKTFAGSRLVALDAYGHASVAMPSLCMAKHLREYLANGTLPEENVMCERDGEYFPGSDKSGPSYSLEEEETLAAQRALAENLQANVYW